MPGPNVGRAEVDVHADLSPFRRELQAAALLAGRQYGDTLADSLDTRLRRASGVLDRFWLSNLRGSRNDFLNFIGTVSAGFESLIGRGLGSAIGGLADLFDNLGISLAKIDTGPTFLLAGGLRQIAGLIRGFPISAVGAIATQVIGLAAGFSLAVSVLSLAVTTISGLVGVITALAVGLGGALLGGITALLPGVAALGVGIGALALGFSKMSKENKAAIAPLSDFFKELRAGVQERLFDSLARQQDGLIEALRPLGPFLNSIVDVFTDWSSRIIAEIGPGGPLAGAFQTLGTSLPSILRSLLDLLSSASGAIVGLFAAASPAAQRLFDAIGRVVQRFNEWVNSAEGAERVNDFLQRAIDLLGSFWSLAGALGETLRLLWDGAADGAEGIVDGLTNVISRFNEWLGTTEGQQAMTDWFQQAVQFARDMWGVIQELIDIFVQLDSSINRENLQQFLDFLTGGIEALGIFISWVNQLNEVLSNVGDAMQNFVNSGQTMRDAIITALTAAATAVADFQIMVNQALGNALRTIVQGATTIWNNLRTAVTTAVNGARDAVSRFVTSIRNLLNQAIEAISNFISRGRNSFNNLVTNITSAMNRAVNAVRNSINRIVTAFGNLVSRVRTAISNAIAAIQRLPSQAAAAFNRLATSVRNGVSRALTAISNFVSRAVSTISSLPGRFLSIGSNIMSGLYNGIVSGGNRVLGYLRNLASTVASTFANILGIASPSKVFLEFGKNIVEGLVEGLGDGIRQVEQATTGLADAAMIPNTNANVAAMTQQAIAAPDTARVPRGTGSEVTEINVITPYANPRLVALEVMDELAASGK